ncbi:sensor histidine kinase [Photobacterium sanguinicancri]|uniref:histidine kinase n=1 Tax=Photobacterium sanguinicancri TaxID=875932 RepID=A0ABX4FU28_9GAMM|nr:HAMP domain-containing sensor histidine kinase [Photobacterium sanguinicancri]OZS42357.1 two-component sensor histidine kinase [Photobacterium sanguinicancri]
MKINQSLLRIVFASIGSALLLVILCYSLLAQSFYFWGLDNSLAVNSVHVSNLVDQQGIEVIENKIDVIDAEIFRGYDALPEDIKNKFTVDQLKMDEHYNFKVKDNWYDFPRVIYFIHPAQTQTGLTYYIVNTFDDTFLQPEVEKIEEGLPSITMVSGVIIILFIFVGLLLLRYIARPISKLHQWAQQLTLKTLADPVPAFGFRELDDLAEKIHTNLQNIEKTLSRESQFLQHASHELRTPIAVILSNASLMDHMWHDAPPACQKPLDRINRAGLTMSHLTETLLWLTRNKDYQPTIETFNVSQLTEELVEEHQYLLGGKDVTVELALSPVIQALPKVMIRIIIANLIRNAMQHTDSGHILIKLEQESLTIVNWGELLKGEKSDGFGLGIKLVKQICTNQGWHYQQDVVNDACTVNVLFNKVNQKI